MKPFVFAALVCGFGTAVASGQWQPQVIKTDADFRGLSAVGPKVAWVSGTKGTFGRTTDGGKTWTAGTVPDADKLDFRDVEAFGEATAYLLSAGPGEDSRIYKTTDGGKSWVRKPVSEEARSGALEAFWFESRDSGTLLIDLIRPNETGARHERYVTMTGGDSWSLEEVSAKTLGLKRGPPRDPPWRVRADAKSHGFVLERNLGTGEWEITARFPIEVGSCAGE